MQSNVSDVLAPLLINTVVSVAGVVVFMVVFIVMYRMKKKKGSLFEELSKLQKKGEFQDVFDRRKIGNCIKLLPDWSIDGYLWNNLSADVKSEFGIPDPGKNSLRMPYVEQILIQASITDMNVEDWLGWCEQKFIVDILLDGITQMGNMLNVRNTDDLTKVLKGVAKHEEQYGFLWPDIKEQRDKQSTSLSLFRSYLTFEEVIDSLDQPLKRICDKLGVDFMSTGLGAYKAARSSWMAAGNAGVMVAAGLLTAGSALNAWSKEVNFRRASALISFIKIVDHFNSVYYHDEWETIQKNGSISKYLVQKREL